MQTHKDLVVWKRSVQLVVAVYAMTNRFPKEEVFGLTSQMRRAACSVPANIAEGSARGTRKDFAQFVSIACGSAAELETLIDIAESLSYGTPAVRATIRAEVGDIARMLHALRKKLRDA